MRNTDKFLVIHAANVDLLLPVFVITDDQRPDVVLQAISDHLAGRSVQQVFYPAIAFVGNGANVGVFALGAKFGHTFVVPGIDRFQRFTVDQNRANARLIGCESDKIVDA